MAPLESLSGEELLLRRLFGSPSEADAIAHELDRRAVHGRRVCPLRTASGRPRMAMRYPPRLVA